MTITLITFNSFSPSGRMLALLPVDKHARTIHSSTRDGTQLAKDDSEKLWNTPILPTIP